MNAFNNHLFLQDVAVLTDAEVMAFDYHIICKLNSAENWEL